jgi:hypothetical protein
MSKVTIDFLFNNQNKIKPVINKTTTAYNKSDSIGENVFFGYSILFYLLLMTASFMPAILFSLNEIYITIPLALEMFLGAHFLFPDSQSSLKTFFYNSSRKIISYFKKEKADSKLEKIIFDKYNFISKKTKKILNIFYNSLNKEELIIHKTLLDEYSADSTYSFIVSETIKKFLIDNNRQEILNNKKTILALMDTLSETDSSILVDLYIENTNKEGSLKNPVLNQLLDKNDSFAIIKDKKVYIKEL